jgi:exopolyphosphatase / guanosine-5'-triphosphate,3'-diphosphate pyrophosphatase
MTVAAAIDIGSNSVHVLVAAVSDDAGLETLLDENLQAGLGLVVDRQGRLGATARRATVAVVADFALLADDMGADRILLMGTQPLRRATDRSLLRREIRAALGLELVVLSHAQEAALTLLGVTGGASVDAPLLVMDVGGGSSEVILITPGATPVVGAVAVGSSRLAAAVVTHDPPTPDEIAELRSRAAAFAEGLPVGAPGSGIVSGGSGTNVSRLLSRERTTPVTLDDLAAGLALLQTSAAIDVSAATGLTERRVRQLAAGIALVEALMLRYGLSVTAVSDAGLREGAVLAAERLGSTWLVGLPGLTGG